MKNKIILAITVGCLLFCAPQAQAKLSLKKILKGVGKVVGSVAEAAGATVLQKVAVSGGYSQEEATQFTKNVYSNLELNSRNAELGLQWNNAENKYDQQNIVKEFAFDAAGNISGEYAFVDKFRTMADAQITYLRDMNKSGSVEEKQTAFDKRTKIYADLFYDTYQEGKERKAQHLAEKLQIRNQLLEKGYTDPEFALEVAGSIIAVQKSNLSYEEKEAILKGYGFSESPEQIAQYVNEVMKDSYVSTANTERIEAERIKAEEEAKRQAELARQAAERKAAEERKNAIQQIKTTKLDGYSFDATALSQDQKATLDNVAVILNQYSDVKVLIVGHTCNIGYKNINQKKGLKRAEAGKKYLIEKGISQERISIDSKGEIQPLVQNLSEENRKQNRRIEFIIE
jgi:outer membrane protein OmpA-like peptidoglycan-associated protein